MKLSQEQRERFSLDLLAKMYEEAMYNETVQASTGKPEEDAMSILLEAAKAQRGSVQ